MEPNPYESPKEGGPSQPYPRIPRTWLKDKARLVLIALAIILFGLGPIYLFFYWLVGP